MIEVDKVTWEDMEEHIIRLKPLLSGKKIYGIPRGGKIVEYLAAKLVGAIPVSTPLEAELFVDDLIDSGRTAKRWMDAFGIPTIPAYEKKGTKWVVFPWEESDGKDIGETVERIIEWIGVDLESDGLRETPGRVVNAMQTLYSGYAQDPREILKWFEDDSDEMIIARDIEFYSTCEHHMLPFFGTAHIAYIPRGRVLGISKIARLVDCFARRLQIQERLTRQIGKAIALGDGHGVQGVGVVLKGKHLCMMSRGVQKQNSEIVTSYLSGVFRDKPESRAEFMRLID